MSHYDFITVGNYTKDTIVSAAGTRHVDGGGYNYAAHAAKLAGLACRRRHAARRRRRRRHGPALRRRHRRLCLRLAELDAHAARIPDGERGRAHPVRRGRRGPDRPRHFAGLSAHTFLVTASIRGEVSPATVKAMKERSERLALDVQGFVRIVSPEGRLRYEAWPERDLVLGMTDILKTDAVEAEFLTGTADIREAARILAALGPREIVLTHKDGLLVLADGQYHEAGFHPVELRGRSGRGDTCVGSYASRRLEADPAEATRWAAAVTSLKLEAEGPIRRSRADVERLLKERY